MTVAELEPYLVGNYLQGNVHGLNKGFNFVVQTAINQMNVKGKLDGEWVYQEAKGKGAKENQRNSVNLSSTSSTPLRQKKVSDLGICDREI
eukprot:g18693.t1